MSKTNCINCGAAKDIDDVKCPFCGTTYLDLTAIDFDSDRPVVCQFMMPGTVRNQSGQKVIMSMLAIPRLEEITITNRSVDVVGGYGSRKLCTLSTGYDMDVGVSFKPVAHPKTDSLFSIKTR